MLERMKGYALLLNYLLLTVCRDLPLAVYHTLKQRRAAKAAGGAESFGILCISHVPWSSAWQRNHHTMYGLSKRHKVVYCFPVVLSRGNLAFLAADGRQRRDGHGSSGLLVIEPRILPGQRVLPFVRALNRTLLVGALRQAMARMRLGARVLWFYSPLHENLAGSLDELLTVYDIQDEYSEYLGRPDYVREKERRLLRKVELVFTGTYALHEDKKQYNGNMHFVGCGVDTAHFGKARDQRAQLPADMAQVVRPVIGYFGRVCGRMDTDLLAAMADRHPEWSIVLIGDVIVNDFVLAPRPNVFLLGEKSYSDLPQYVRGFDVCMIPFRLNQLTLKVNPTKLLEYMAAGKPVVSTAIPDMMRFYGDVIDIARNKDEFIVAVENTLRRNHDGASDAVNRGIAIAHGNDWAATIARMESLIVSDLQRKHGAASEAIRPA